MRINFQRCVTLKKSIVENVNSCCWKAVRRWSCALTTLKHRHAWNERIFNVEKLIFQRNRDFNATQIYYRVCSQAQICRIFKHFIGEWGCKQWSLYFSTLYFKTTLDYKTAWFGPKGSFLSVLNDLYFKTTCNIRPHFLGPMGGLKIEGPLYFVIFFCITITFSCYQEPCLCECICFLLIKLHCSFFFYNFWISLLTPQQNILIFLYHHSGSSVSALSLSDISLKTNPTDTIAPSVG